MVFDSETEIMSNILLKVNKNFEMQITLKFLI